MLVEILGVSIPRFARFRGPFGPVLGATGHRLFNPLPLALEQFAGAIWIHAGQTTAGPGPGRASFLERTTPRPPTHWTPAPVEYHKENDPPILRPSPVISKRGFLTQAA